MFNLFNALEKTILRYFFLLFICLLGFPTNAYAYLDPGSGNALVYLFISLLGTFIYFAKNIVYKIIGKIRGEKHVNVMLSKEHENIVIFSEGKSYWFTFKPIVEAFIEKQVPFSYITIDINDPALTIDNPYMASKYLGDGSSAFAKAANKRAKLMLATTPNIGSENFPMPRPKHVECLAHIFHSVGDIATYQKGSLDYYDTALMVGDYMEESIRTLEKVRNLPAKECISLGLPYLDVLTKKVEKKDGQSEPPTILVAPAWGEKGCFSLCGTEFVHDIAKAKYNIIIRPHPHSWKVEQDFIASLQEELRIYENIRFDDNPDGTDSLKQADLLISDKSGVRFDFALLYERPVITIDAPLRNIEQYEYADIRKCWEDSVAHELGAVIIPNQDFDILPSIEKALSMPTSQFQKFKEKYIMNFGTSGKAIAEWAIEKTKQIQ